MAYALRSQRFINEEVDVSVKKFFTSKDKNWSSACNKKNGRNVATEGATLGLYFERTAAFVVTQQIKLLL